MDGGCNVVWAHDRKTLCVEVGACYVSVDVVLDFRVFVVQDWSQQMKTVSISVSFGGIIVYGDVEVGYMFD